MADLSLLGAGGCVVAAVLAPLVVVAVLLLLDAEPVGAHLLVVLAEEEGEGLAVGVGGARPRALALHALAALLARVHRRRGVALPPANRRSNCDEIPLINGVMGFKDNDSANEMNRATLDPARDSLKNKFIKKLH